MIPYTAYDIINAVNREVDLTRTPVREHYHEFGGPDGPSQNDQNGQGGPGFPVSRSPLGRLTHRMTAVLHFGARTRQPQPIS